VTYVQEVREETEQGGNHGEVLDELQGLVLACICRGTFTLGHTGRTLNQRSSCQTKKHHPFIPPGHAIDTSCGNSFP